MTLFEQKYENPEWKGYTKFLPEVIGVKVRVKKIMRIPIQKNFGYEQFKKLCDKLGLITGLSDYKINPPYLKENIIKDNTIEGDRFMYVAANKKNLELAKKYDLEDEEKFGELCGYPKCCVEYYNKIMINKPDHEIYNYIKSGKKLNWQNNYLLRFNSNYYLLAYFICSFDCKKSIAKANKVFKGIKEFDETFAKKIEYHLKLPILFDDSKKGGIIYNWNKLKGVVLNGKITNGNIVDYDDHFALWEEHRFPLFDNYKTLKINDTILELTGANKVSKTIHNKDSKKNILIKFD